MFSKFGKVNYVSLPRYKKSRQIKQFGFIEFDDEESITKAITAFRKFDGVLQYSSLKPENLLSIVTHEKEETETPAEKDEQESDEPPAKKARLESETEESKAVEPSEDKEEEVDKQEDDPMSQDNDNDESDDSEPSQEKPTDEQPDGEAKKKKKNRKHKKKKVGQKAFFDEKVMAIKIMRKKEWKKMRNSYLNLERQKAKEIKKILRESFNKRNNNKIQENQKFSPANTASPRINFYKSPNDREEPTEAAPESKVESTASGLSFVPGVIVNIKFREPCLDYKELKKELKQYSYVCYVDVLEGGAQCYVRVDAASSAQELVTQYSGCEYETEVLKNEAEKEYWKKIFERRDAKKSKDSPKKEPAVRRRRGREKLVEKINKAAQHIRFEENEEAVE